MMPRPQFTLRALFVATLVVAAFFAGRRSQISDALWEEREAMTECEAGLTEREKAVYLDEAKLMKGWHQLRAGGESLR